MRILTATDGSDAANRAIELAATLAAGLKGQLKIVHVVSLDTLPVDQLREYALGEHESLADVVNTFAEQKLAAARQVAEARGAQNITVESPFGDVTECIIDSAREYGAELIVVGRRGRGRLTGLLLGSVSQKIASVAPCPVIVVP